MPLLLLPGLDGTGRLFGPFAGHLPADVRPIVVACPPGRALGYDALLPTVLDAIPPSDAFAILGESFSGPLEVRARAVKEAVARGADAFRRRDYAGAVRALEPFAGELDLVAAKRLETARRKAKA